MLVWLAVTGLAAGYAGLFWLIIADEREQRRQERRR